MTNDVKMKMKRATIIAVALVVIPLLFIYTSPDAALSPGEGGTGLPISGAGAELFTFLLYMSRVFLLIIFVHFMRQGFFTYPGIPMHVLFQKALGSSEGAGMALIAMGLFVLSISGLVIATMFG